MYRGQGILLWRVCGGNGDPPPPPTGRQRAQGCSGDRGMLRGSLAIRVTVLGIGSMGVRCSRLAWAGRLWSCPRRLAVMGRDKAGFTHIQPPE